MQRGRFITIEGGEGAGKTTQIQLLMTAFADAKLAVLHTREPGGTPGAEAVRNLLVRGDAEAWDPVAETLLFFAARREHVAKRIQPALDAGTHVICDRFLDSTRVYQGYGKGLGDAFIQSLQRIALGNATPDLTLWLDVPVDVGLARAVGRADTQETRFESLGKSFHETVRNGFEAIAQEEPHRFFRIDAGQKPEKVHADILAVLHTRLGLLV